MQNGTYLNWVIQNTATTWWHDSAESVELDLGLERGAVGVTTNPFLSNVAVNKDRKLWEAEINAVLAQNLAPEAKAEALMRVAVTKAAEKLMPQFVASKGEAGHVCAQVNPARAGDRDFMFAMAKRLHSWSPNISVKLPATAAGLDGLEDCVAEGICVTATVAFTVPQAVWIAERHRAGQKRAKANGIVPGKCFAVIMIGRLDDFLREVANDNKAAVSEADICQAGLAATKRAIAIYKERAYDAVLLIAALRGDYHFTELAGANVVMSIAPGFQGHFVDKDHPHEARNAVPVPADVIERLSKMPEFVRAYEPDGMKPEDFVSFGATQRTLCQFVEVGWKLMENYR